MQITSTYQTLTIAEQVTLDAIGRLKIKEAFESFYKENENGCLFDLGKVQWINSSGIALLIELKKTSIERGFYLEFINVSDQLRIKMNEAGLERILFYQ